MKRAIGVFVSLALVAALVAGCSGTSTQGSSGSTTATKSPVKIGAILSLTGSYAGLGAPEKAAIEMEQERINSAGGIDGHPIDVVIQDDATDPQKAVAAATKLIDQDKVVVILGATGTGSTMAIRTETDRAAVPVISMAGGSAITAQFDKNCFQTPWPNSIVVPFTLAAMKQAGLTSIGVIASDDGYGKDAHQVVLDTVKKDGGVTIVADETFHVGDTDMTVQLTKIRAKNPKVIWLLNAGKEAAIVAKNLKQIDPQGTMKLYGMPGNARQEFITGAGPAAEGFTFAAGKILLPETYGVGTPEYKVATDFVDRYKKATGNAPDIFAGHADDALAIAVDSLKRAGADASGAKLRDAIEATKDLIGIGGTFTYSPTDHNGLTDKDLVMYRIAGGTWTLAK